MKARIDKLIEIKRVKNLDGFLITSFASLKYLSGYYFYFEHGISPFQLLPAALIVNDELNASIVLADNETLQSDFIDPAISITTYESYVYEKPLDHDTQFLMQMHNAFKQSGINNGRIGVELHALPASVALLLTTQYPTLELV
ncbi:MAG: aminopeptidase P family N-terminal domain-containing protein, partial [Ginsengibacter sp.]